MRAKMVAIPFSVIPPRMLAKLSIYVMGWANALSKFFPYLQLEIDRTDLKVEAKRYLAMCIVASLFLFVILSVVLTLFLVKIEMYFLGVVVAFLFSLMAIFMQLNYPKVLAHRRIRKLDADLLAALRAIMIQLNSGVPLFESLVITSKQEFGEVSKELEKAVKQINAGVSQLNALETLALKNPSPYFRRSIWQIMNGMKEGANINEVMGNVIANLTKEQIIQIEKYGSQLSPIAMFYMMGAVIIPALGITFLIVLSSFIKMDDVLVKILFFGLLAFIVFFQIMSSGIIKTKRPSLLGD
ncbi:type II secretion system F family protein [Candidatus Woesearchaeota archaeon]|nr:type II secretion system F family protein [Candidatus Woesearchaeota archaeon]